MSGRMDWEKAARRDVVITHGAVRAEPSTPGRAVWMSDRDRDRLLELGWYPTRRGGTLLASHARELRRALAGLGVTRSDIAAAHAIADDGARVTELERLRAKIDAGEQRTLARHTDFRVEVTRAAKALRGGLAMTGRIGTRGGSVPTPSRRLADMTADELNAMRTRRRLRRRG